MTITKKFSGTSVKQIRFIMHPTTIILYFLEIRRFYKQKFVGSRAVHFFLQMYFTPLIKRFKNSTIDGGTLYGQLLNISLKNAESYFFCGTI